MTKAMADKISRLTGAMRVVLSQRDRLLASQAKETNPDAYAVDKAYLDGRIDGFEEAIFILRN